MRCSGITIPGRLWKHFREAFGKYTTEWQDVLIVQLRYPNLIIHPPGKRNLPLPHNLSIQSLGTSLDWLPCPVFRSTARQRFGECWPMKPVLAVETSAGPHWPVLTGAVQRRGPTVSGQHSKDEIIFSNVGPSTEHPPSSPVPPVDTAKVPAFWLISVTILTTTSPALPLGDLWETTPINVSL